MLFGPKKSGVETANVVAGTPVVTITPQMVEQIHVMPSRFQLHPRTKSNRWFVAIGLGVIVAGAVVAATLVVLKMNGTDSGPTATSTPTGVASPPTEPAPVSPEPAPTPAPPPAPAPTPEPTPAPEPATAPDADGDGLSADEELLYSTLPASADSDSDGYPDGHEVTRGYSPRVAGVTLLADGLVSQYAHASKLAWWYPAVWEPNDASAASGLLIFDSRQGEQVAVTVRPNDGSRTPQQWMAEDGLSGLQLLEVVPAGFSGARTASGREVYLVSPDRAWVVAFRYTPDWVTAPKYPTTLLMMAASLRVTP